MIPIAKPFLDEKEEKTVSEVILSGWITQGPKVKEFEDSFAAFVGSKYACAGSSCTTALHLALITVGVRPGDIVITVSHSFIATANAIRHCGAEPVFVDIDPKTFNMSPNSLRKCIEDDCEMKDNELFYKHISKILHNESPLRSIKNSRIGRIKAFIPVHQMGMPCDIGRIVSIANEYNIPVVEDAACAIGSKVNIKGEWDEIGKPHGNIACFSLHPRKIITTGDGGIITTNNKEYDKKIRLLRNHGMNIPADERHNSKKVKIENYITTGYNYRMTDIQAAVGIEQLKKLPKIIVERRRIDKLYRKFLANINWLELPYEPDYAVTNWQSYPVKVLKGSPISRNELIQYLLHKDIAAKPGIMNAHSEKPYLNAEYFFKNSEEARNQIILLPLFYGIGEKNVTYIASTIQKIV